MMRLLRLFVMHFNSVACKCLALVITTLVFTTVTLPSLSGFNAIMEINFDAQNSSVSLNSEYGIRKMKFLEVPQIVWGLNNQKIAFARSCLTARMLNRTLLMPSLSASLFYKETDLLRPISFDKLCNVIFFLVLTLPSLFDEYMIDRLNLSCNWCHDEASEFTTFSFSNASHLTER
ncbi:hypothetical protein AG4045_015608 [Apium graveolens]|uniref:O-fucosyltransferase family protein n=1 Tax=Apium graveolens TaxID=4045 RepID=A0A6L5BER6_APIGR|nr:hypothetical protein AG4045_015608 [Apium graveolens]